MRVLHVTNIYPTAADPGAGLFIKTQVESLVAAGVVCDVCVLKGRGLGKYIRGWATVRRQVRSGDYALVHAHYMYTGWVARLATCRPLVVSFMGSDVFGHATASGRHGPLSLFLHVVGANLLSLVASHSIVKSTGLGRALLTPRRSVIPNGVDLNVFRRVPAARDRVNLAASKKYVLFAGNPSNPVKRFVLAERSMARLKERVPTAELIWLSGKGSDTVALYLNAVDCLLLTSAHEGSSNIIKESLACDLPVVSVSVGDAVERLEGIDNCHVVSPDPTAIADALCRVLLSGRRAQNASAAVRPLSLPVVAARIKSIYTQIVDGRAGAGSTGGAIPR